MSPTTGKNVHLVNHPTAQRHNDTSLNLLFRCSGGWNNVHETEWNEEYPLYNVWSAEDDHMLVKGRCFDPQLPWEVLVHYFSDKYSGTKKVCTTIRGCQDRMEKLRSPKGIDRLKLLLHVIREEGGQRIPGDPLPGEESSYDDVVAEMAELSKSYTDTVSNAKVDVVVSSRLAKAATVIPANKVMLRRGSGAVNSAMAAARRARGSVTLGRGTGDNVDGPGAGVTYDAFRNSVYLRDSGPRYRAAAAATAKHGGGGTFNHFDPKLVQKLVDFCSQPDMVERQERLRARLSLLTSDTADSGSKNTAGLVEEEHEQMIAALQQRKQQVWEQLHGALERGLEEEERELRARHQRALELERVKLEAWFEQQRRPLDDFFNRQHDASRRLMQVRLQGRQMLLEDLLQQQTAKVASVFGERDCLVRLLILAEDMKADGLRAALLDQIVLRHPPPPLLHGLELAQLEHDAAPAPERGGGGEGEKLEAAGRQQSVGGEKGGGVRKHKVKKKMKGGAKRHRTSLHLANAATGQAQEEGGGGGGGGQQQQERVEEGSASSSVPASVRLLLGPELRSTLLEEPTVTLLLQRLRMPDLLLLEGDEQQQQQQQQQQEKDGAGLQSYAGGVSSSPSSSSASSSSTAAGFTRPRLLRRELYARRLQAQAGMHQMSTRALKACVRAVQEAKQQQQQQGGEEGKTHQPQEQQEEEDEERGWGDTEGEDGVTAAAAAAAWVQENEAVWFCDVLQLELSRRRMFFDVSLLPPHTPPGGGALVKVGGAVGAPSNSSSSSSSGLPPQQQERVATASTPNSVSASMPTTKQGQATWGGVASSERERTGGGGGWVEEGEAEAEVEATDSEGKQGQRKGEEGGEGEQGVVQLLQPYRYCTVRANRGRGHTGFGKWQFEVRVERMPEGGGCICIGWDVVRQGVVVDGWTHGFTANSGNDSNSSSSNSPGASGRGGSRVGGGGERQARTMPRHQNRIKHVRGAEIPGIIPGDDSLAGCYGVGWQSDGRGTRARRGDQSTGLLQCRGESRSGYPCFMEGDVITCTLDQNDGQPSVRFYLNGALAIPAPEQKKVLGDPYFTPALDNPLCCGGVAVATPQHYALVPAVCMYASTAGGGGGTRTPPRHRLTGSSRWQGDYSNGDSGGSKSNGSGCMHTDDDLGSQEEAAGLHRVRFGFSGQFKYPVPGYEPYGAAEEGTRRPKTRT